MKTLLIALCILLVMLGSILLVNHRILVQLAEISDTLTALPPMGDASCLSRASALEAQWRALRPLVALAINGRTVGEIDRLTLALRATAASAPNDACELEWMQLCAMLENALRDLRMLLRCGIWEIV
jgi:hypothetical protein